MLIDQRLGNPSFDHPYIADCVIVGGGLIGMSLALEMQHRGAMVIVIERARSLLGASIAAAGMLAVADPHNPVEISELSRFSAAAYPSFLDRIEDLSKIRIPFQTDITVQYQTGGSTVRIPEHSLDPRQLAEAIHLAIESTSVRLMHDTVIAANHRAVGEVQITTASGANILAKTVVFAAGAWTAGVLSALKEIRVPIAPRKGLMLRVRLPSALPLREVHRSEHVYIVPRSVGHQAGSALIGATVEDVDFDMTLRVSAISQLRKMAAEVLPALASEDEAPLVECWAGLRPFAPDSLPVIGESMRRGCFIASGHYRNGILLAPGTAVVAADLIEGKRPDVDVALFSPRRFSTNPAR